MKTIINVVFYVLYSPFKFIHFFPVHLTFFPISLIFSDRLYSCLALCASSMSFLQGITVLTPNWTIKCINPNYLQDQVFSLSLVVICFHSRVDNIPYQYLLLTQLSTLLQKCQTLYIFLICRL